ATQAEREFVEASLRARIRLRLCRIGVRDQIQTSFEVVEYGHLLAEHQQHIRDAELIRAVPMLELGLDVADAFETEVADQAAAEFRHVRQLRHTELRTQTLDLGQRIGDAALLGRVAELLDAEPAPVQFVYFATGQADDRIAPPGFAAFDRFEQV